LERGDNQKDNEDDYQFSDCFCLTLRQMEPRYLIIMKHCERLRGGGFSFEMLNFLKFSWFLF